MQIIRSSTYSGLSGMIKIGTQWSLRGIRKLVIFVFVWGGGVGGPCPLAATFDCYTARPFPLNSSVYAFSPTNY